MANIEEKVENLICKTIEDLGYELYDVIYEKEAQDYYLRIFIDTPNGISLEDCEKVNDAINDMLDEANYIKDQYFLEVSSPGVERVLRKEKHFDSAMGETIQVKLYKPVEKKKEIEGILTGYDEDTITMTYENDEISVPKNNIAQIKTKHNWDE